MSRTSGPLMLIALVVGGWTIGRVTYVSLSSAVPPINTHPSMSPLTWPFAPLAPPVAGGSADISALQSHAPNIRLANGVHSPPRIAAGNNGGGDALGRGSSIYVRQQLALLHMMLQPSPNANAPMLRAMPLAGSGPWAAEIPPAASASFALASGTPDRWALSAWAFHRSGSAAPSLGGQGQLGGSQAGARLSYRLDGAGRATLFARVSATPQGAGQGAGVAEGAVGVTLRPVRSLPLSLVVERRQRLTGRDGRGAMAAYITGGVSDAPLVAGFTLDAYGAAGVVGARRRDAFAEGQLRATHALTRAGAARIRVGAGAWGATQPGVSRVDIGPSLVIRVERASAPSPRLSVDYRQRVAGDAVPSSGVALTLAADF
ncbi:MAG: hypothetical protein AABZ45_01910 [Pseudomonadota bacterium]